MKHSISKISAVILLSNLIIGYPVMAQKASLDLDIQGLKLGMTPEQAMPIVEKLAKNAQKRVNVRSAQLVGRDAANGKYIPLPNGKITMQIANGSIDMQSDSTEGSDEISVNFTTVPGNEKLAAIYRKLQFKTGAKPINSNLSNDIFTKYGKPTLELHNYRDFYVWAYDNKGDLMKSWAGKECLINFPKPTSWINEPTSTNNSWSLIIKREWVDKDVLSYYKSCGSKLLIIESFFNSQIKTVDKSLFMFYDIQAIIDGHTKANEMMAAVSQNATKAAIQDASRIKPAL